METFLWYMFVSMMSYMLTGMLSRMLQKKPRSQEARGAGGWNPITTQRDNIPYEYVFGRVPVQGNIFSVHTEVVNTTEILRWLIQIAWGWIPPSDDNLCVLASRHQINCRLGFGEGPVKGLVAGYSRVNGKPIGDITGITTYERLGTDSQTATGMGDRAEFPRNDKVEVGTPVTVLMPDADYDDVAVMLYSEGLVHYNDSGGRVESRMQVKIEIREVGGSWHTLFNWYLFGKTANPIRWLFMASGTYQGGTPFTVVKGTQHEWKVTCLYRLTSMLAQGLLYVSAVQEIYGDAHRFPGLSFLEMRAFAAEQLDGNLEFEGVLDGLILEPIDPEGDIEWSDNPARAMKYIFCRPVILGDGSGTPYSVEYYRGYDPSHLNQADFLAYEAWCDEHVPDGKGGTPHRFRFNGRFTDQGECWEQAARIGAMSRALPWFDGQQVRIYIDRPATPSHLYCVSNMDEDSYHEHSIDQRAVPSRMEAEIFNETGDYARQSYRAIDNLGTGTRTEQIDGFGMTSVPQFHHFANFIFDKGRNLDLVSEWTTIYGVGLDAKVGDAAYVQHDSNARAIGGRVVSAAGDTVVIDKAVSMTPGKSYVLIVQTIDDDGKHVTSYDVDSLTNVYTVVLTGALTYVPVQADVFIFGETDKIDIYRIAAIGWQPDGKCQFAAEQYKVAFFARDNTAPTYDTSISLVGAQAARKGWRPITRQDLLNGLPEDRIYDGIHADTVTWGRLTFTGDNVDHVTWAGTDEDSLGWVRYRGQTYPIQSDATGTTARYIYFDPAVDNAGLLQSTNDPAVLAGYQRFVLCINQDGRAYPRSGAIAGGDALLINTDELSTGATGVKAFQEHFDNPFNDLATRWVKAAGGGEVTIQTGGSAGGSVMRVGNNNGSDGATLYYFRSIPFDPNALYRMRVRVRRTAGAGLFFAGVAGRNAGDTAWVNTAGADLLTSQHTICAASDEPLSDWDVYTGYFKGRAATGDSLPHMLASSPAVLHNDVRYFRPFLICNYNDVAGTMEIDELAIDVMPDDQAVPTSALEENAVTKCAAAFTAAGTYIGTEETTEQTVNITTTGANVLIHWGAQLGYYSAAANAKLRLYRGDTLLIELGPFATASGDQRSIFATYIDNPSAGAQTYTLRAIVTTGSQAYLSHRSLTATEYKR